MAYIKSHVKVDETLKDNYSYSSGIIDTKIQQTKKNSKNLNGISLAAEDAATYLVYLEPTSSKIKKLYQIYFESSIAMFRLSLENGDISCLISGEEFILINYNVESSIFPNRWLYTFFTAEFLGNESMLQLLCNFPTPKLRDSTTKTEEYAYFYVDFLKAFWQDLPGQADLLIKVLDATDPKLTSFGTEHALHVIVPQIELFTKLYENDEAAFNTGLEKALNLHKKYYSSSKDLKNRPQAFVSLGLVFIVRMAKKHGFNITVTSEYIPEILLTI